MHLHISFRKIFKSSKIKSLIIHLDTFKRGCFATVSTNKEGKNLSNCLEIGTAFLEQTQLHVVWISGKRRAKEKIHTRLVHLKISSSWLDLGTMVYVGPGV